MKTSVLAFAMSILISANVAAAEPRTSGIVIGNDIGRIDIESDGKGSYGAMLGYRFNPNLAVVGYARSFGDFLVDVQGDGAPTSHVGVGAMGSVAVHERVNLYGIAGIGRTKVRDDRLAGSSSHHVNEASVSLGMRFAIGRNFGLKLEHTTLLDSSVHINSVGIDYQF